MKIQNMFAVFCLVLITGLAITITGYETSYEAWGFGHGWPFYGYGSTDICCYAGPFEPYPNTYPLDYARFIEEEF